jgi:WD40 repeat protein
MKNRPGWLCCAAAWLLCAWGTASAQEKVKALLTPEPAVEVKALDRDATKVVATEYSYAPTDSGWKPVPAAPVRDKPQLIGDGRLYCPLTVCGIAASPDGKWLVYGTHSTFGSPLFVYDRATGKEAVRLHGHLAGASRLVFSPDSKRLYSGGNNLGVWDFAGRKLVAVIQSGAWALTPDAGILVTLESVAVPSSGKETIEALLARTRPVVRVRDTKTWKSLNDYAVNGFDPATVAVTPDGKVIALGGLDGTVRLWDRKAGKELASLPKVSEHVSALDFSPDGKLLAAGGCRTFGPDRDETVLLWDWSADKVVHRLTRHVKEVQRAVFSPDGKHLVTTRGFEVIVWDVKSGKVVAERQGLHVNPCFLKSKGEMRLVCPKRSGRPAFVTFPELKDADPEVKLDERPLKLPFETVDPFPPGEKRRSEISLPSGRTVRAIPLDSEEGLRLGVGLYERGKLVRAFEKDRASVFDVDVKGKLLAAHSRRYDGQGDHQVRLWDVDTGKEVAALRYYPTAYYALRFSPDGRRLAIFHQDGFVRLWDVKTLKPVLALDSRWQPYPAVLTFSKDGKKLVTGDRTAPVAAVWDVTAGKE